MAINANPWRVPVLMLTEPSSKINPLLDDLFRGQAAAYNAYKVRIILVQGNVVCGQHAYAQTRSQCCVQEITNQSLVLNKQNATNNERKKELGLSHRSQNQKYNTHLAERRYSKIIVLIVNFTVMCLRHSLNPSANMVTTSV